MRIAVIGTGHVGSALGNGWSRAGHQVVFGSRDPQGDEARALMSPRSGVSVASPRSAAEQAEIIALAVPWTAVPEVLQELGCLEGKVLIDCTNPAKGWPAMDHSGGSGGEQVAALASGAKVVKAFNTTGFENMENPKYAEAAATMFYAGDDAAAKKLVHKLAADLGFDPQDSGTLSQSHALEILASLWGSLAYGQKLGRGIAFRIMRR